MKKRNFLLGIILLFSHVVFSQIYEPIHWNVNLKKVSGNSGVITFEANIEKGWHLYGMQLPEGGPKPTRIVFSGKKNFSLDGTVSSLSPVHEVYDPNFEMKLQWYATKAVFAQKISFDDFSDVEARGYIEYMACNDENCLPPVKDPFYVAAAGSPNSTPSSTKNTVVPMVKPLVSDGKQLGDSTSKSPIKSLSTQTDFWKPVIAELRQFGEQSLETGSVMSLWFVFLAGLVGGFLALLTPCVWPIIPMTVSFFLKRSTNRSKARRDALFYTIAIVVLYVLLGLVITVLFGASALNSLSTNAFFNILFFLLFVFFAISFFGVFEITLPSSWTTRLDAKADQTSGFLSILFMAFTLALVSFSCTGPIIGTLLVEVASSGSLIAPAVGMMGFAIALAIPFGFFAFFPSMLNSLPRSGSWLNKVKVILAFLELALALKFLSVADLAYGWGMLDREIFIAIWIVLFSLLGFYLLGKIRFSHDSSESTTSIGGLVLAILSFSFSLYMVPGLWGAPLKAISAFTPPLYTQDFNLYDSEVHAQFTDYDKGMEYAAQKGLPVIVDFSGYGCVNCREMESKVWTDMHVKEKIEKDFVLITLYVDDKTPLSEPLEVKENNKVRFLETVGDKWSNLQRLKFGANAQPFYVMLNNEGIPINRAYTFDENPERFLDWLNGK